MFYSEGCHSFLPLSHFHWAFDGSWNEGDEWCANYAQHKIMHDLEIKKRNPSFFWSYPNLQRLTKHKTNYEDDHNDF